MKILVDTRAFFWWLTGDPKLSSRARDLLEDKGNDLMVSSVVAWELATKSRIGKWPSGVAAADEIDRLIETNRLRPLAISVAHARLAGRLPGDHRDPFDRMLAAQSDLEGVPLVTRDRIFRDFGIEVLW